MGVARGVVSEEVVRACSFPAKSLSSERKSIQWHSLRSLQGGRFGEQRRTGFTSELMRRFAHSRSASAWASN